jgi:hypothetical protein
MHWWAPGVIAMPSMELGSGTRGGYARVKWGSIDFAPNAFSGEPPAKAQIYLDWGLSSDNLMRLFNGTIYRRSYESRKLSYDLYEPEYTTKLLDDGTDEQGNDCVRPLVVGTVTHMSPQRTEPDTAEKYYMPDFATYSFYDDGVLIDDHWTIGGGYAERSLAIVGELSMSGTGNMTTLADVFSWACTRMGITFENVHGADVSLNHAVYDQQLLVDYLDKIAWYCRYQFTILDGVLTLVDMGRGVGERTLGRVDSLDLRYNWPLVVKRYKAEWTVREFDAETVSLKSVGRSAVHYTDSAVGEDETTVTPYDEAVADVEDKLDAIAAGEALVSVSLDLPLDQIPRIGEEINFTDRKKAHDISGYFMVRSYRVDHKAKKAQVQGDGEIVFS